MRNMLQTYNSAVYYTDMIYLHNDILLTNTLGYERQKFSEIYTPQMKS